MAKGKKKDNKPASLKKTTYNQLSIQLESSLTWLKDLLGEKKYATRVKKAAKILSDGIREKPEKKIKAEKGKSSKKAVETADTSQSNA